MTTPTLSRPDAIERLAQYGIAGADVYLLDLLPLIEMIWADGLVQPPEMDLLDGFVAEHVSAINQVSGSEILTVEGARRFAWRFLKERPAEHLMEELRSLIPPVRLNSSDGAGNEARRQAIIEWCLDIGASCVAQYPYGGRERFKDSEKQRFLEILKALSQPRSGP
jgi:hypothetical protein